MSTPFILLLGTCDSKLEEILYLRTQILAHCNCSVLLADVGRTPQPAPEIDISQKEILSHAPDGSPSNLSQLSRGEFISHISQCATNLVQILYQERRIHAMIGLGGSGGTSLCAAVMRNALPIGFPKLIVSTMASGNTVPYVCETDITMMYSVVDIAGMNSILEGILKNAGAAIASMGEAYWKNSGEDRVVKEKRKKAIGLTMFGITTPCVEMITAYLQEHGDYEIYVFHATGSGGRAMERLVMEKRIDAVLDVTTTEIADYICGGTLSAGPERLSAAAKMGIPQIVSVGACDCVTFGPRDTVPKSFANRILVQHNPDITLMRSNADECGEIGEFIAKKLRENCKVKENVKVWLPGGGTSLLAVKNGKFYDEEADRRLIDTIKGGLERSGIQVVVSGSDISINSREFAEGMARDLISMIERSL